MQPVIRYDKNEEKFDTKPIVIRRCSFGYYSLIDYNSPVYEALGVKRHPWHIYNKKELLAYLDSIL